MSSNVRHAAKRDSNEAEIVDCLRKLGCKVDRISGTGVPDLLVGYRGANLLMEVKVPGRKLRPAQEKWHSEWRGQKAVVETVDDAICVLVEYDGKARLAGLE